MVVGNFKVTEGVLKTTSCPVAHLQWDTQFVTWLNPIESLLKERAQSVTSDLSHGWQAL